MRNTMMATAALALLAAPALVQPASAQTAAPTTSGTATGMAAPRGPVTEVQTVADLAAVCAPSPGPLRLESIAYCQGFLNAAGQYHAALNPPGALSRPLFCVTNPAPSVAQSGIAFAAWVEKNPQYAADPALDGLMRWAQETYPCPQPAAPTTSRTTRPGAR